MKLSYKYRIYPNKEQEEIILKNFNFCRFLYNSSLQERKSYYKKHGKSRTYVEQASFLSDIKTEFSTQTETIFSQSLQSTLKQLDSAYSNFFRRIKNSKDSEKPGFPRFKSNDRFNSLCFPQSDFTGFGVKLTDNKLKIFGIPGLVKIEYHRPFEGRCKRIILKKHGDKYYVVLSCDDVPLKPLPKTGNTVAIDLGLSNFITTDTGEQYKHPKPYKTAKEKLAYLQRKLELKKRGSNNRKKLKIRIARTYEKITNIREDFQHKLANKLIRENDKIILEDLNVKSMMMSTNYFVNKGNISDAAMSSFTGKIVYKAERAGRLLDKVNPKNTSKMCSGCGQLKTDLELKDRIYHCQHCGLTMDRDHNAARNILKLGTSCVKTEAPAFRQE
jgi:putative transposase